MASLMRCHHVRDNCRHRGVCGGGDEARQDAGGEQFAIAGRSTRPDIHHAETEHRDKVYRPFPHHSHQGHPEDVAQAEQKDVETDQLAGLGLRDLKLFDHGLRGNGEIARIDICEEGKAADGQVCRQSSCRRPVLDAVSLENRALVAC